MPQRRRRTVRGRKLSSELRRLRERMKMSGDHVAEELNWSQSKVSRIETGRTPVTQKDLRQLLELYEVPEDEHEKYVELSRGAGVKGWWDDYADAIPRDYATYIELENEACSLRTFAPQIVTGLLQTEEYARRVIASALLISPPGEVNRRVKVRMERQERLMRDGARSIAVVLDEAVLHRQVGGPQVMRGQLEHLLEAAQRDNVTIQIMPFSVGEHPASAGEFTILGFPGEGDDDVAHVEAIASSLYIEDETKVFRYTLAFNQLCVSALTPEKSVDRIASLLE